MSCVPEEDAAPHIEQRVRRPTEPIHSGTLDWDLKTGKSICSTELEQIFGLPGATYQGDPKIFSPLVHPDDRGLVTQKLDASLRGPKGAAVDFRILTPDGELKWIAARAGVLHDAEGRPERWVGVAYDITGRKRAEKLTVAQDAIAETLASAESLAAAAPRILQIICEHSQWDLGALWLLDPDERVLRRIDLWRNSGGGSVEARPGRTCVRGEKLPGFIWASDEPVWLEDLPASRAGYPNVRGACGFPLRSGGRLVGVMEFLSHEIRPPEADTLHLFSSLGGQIGQAFERLRAGESLLLSYETEKRLRENADRARERIAGLQNLTASLSGTQTLDGVIDLILPHASPMMSASGGVVYLLSPDGSEFQNVRTSGYPEAIANRFRAIAADRPSPISEAVRNRELVVLSAFHPHEEPDPQLEAIRVGAPALVFVPMCYKEHPMGAIALAIGIERAFDPDDRALLLNLGQQCALALERARLHDAEQAAHEALLANMQALQTSEARFRRLVESNVIGIIFGQGESITGANRLFLEMAGYTFEDLLASELNWSRMTPPEFAALDRQAADEARERKAFDPYEKELFRKDGSRVPVLVGGASFHEKEGSPWISFVLDLTCRRQMEESLRNGEARFRAIFDHAPVGIAEASLDGRPTLVNQKFCDITGYSREELQGKPLAELSEPSGRAAHIEMWRRALVGDMGSYCLEGRYLRKDGSTVLALVTVSIARGQDSKPINGVVIVEDITGRKRLETKLLQAQKQDSLGTLAAGIAHDFNNLLTGILGNVSLAWQRTETPAVREMLEDAILASNRAANLTQRMLNYAGRGNLIFASFDLSALLTQIQLAVRPAIPNHIPLRMELPPDLPPLRGDASMIQQVIVNLVVNAAESIGDNPTGEVRISARLERIHRDSDDPSVLSDDIRPGYYEVIKVEDNGSGMDDATLSRIFDPFFTTKFTGRGLGLAASSGIVRAHGGAIQVKSRVGEGTTFSILLPVSP